MFVCIQWSYQYLKLPFIKWLSLWEVSIREVWRSTYQFSFHQMVISLKISKRCMMKLFIIKWLSLWKIPSDKFVKYYYKCFICFMQCKPQLMTASIVSLLSNYDYLPSKFPWEVWRRSIQMIFSLFKKFF